MTEPVPYYVADAFTDRPFAGNPAAVVLLTRDAADGWLQHVAAEFHLAETAFLVPAANGYHLRWFTPKVEVDLCGHATLAAAQVLAHIGRAGAGDEVAFHTRSGRLVARFAPDHIELDFPARPERPADPPAGLVEALGVEPRHVGWNDADYFVEVASEAAVRGVAPDLRRLAAVACRGVIVTARSDDPRFDFVSRFFAPAVGVDEDPVTGSAHCCLAPFWGRRFNKTVTTGYQASARGGVVRCEVAGDRVRLGGTAVVVSRGELLV